MRDVPVVPVIAVVLAVLVVATAAASLSNPNTGGDGQASDEGFGFGSGAGIGAGDDDASGFDLSRDAESVPIDTTYFYVIWKLLSILTVFGIVFAVAYTLWDEGLSGLLSLLKSTFSSAVGVALFLVVVAVLVFFFEQIQGQGGGGMLGSGSVAESVTGQGGSAASSSPVDPSMALLAALAVVFVAALALFSSRSLSSPSELLESDEDESDQRATTVVDREFEESFEDVAPSNPVYRAWLDLVDAAGGTDESTRTPTEIAREATAAGHDPEAVRTVTELFAEVRYGDQRVNEEREERARSARDRLRSNGEGKA